MTTLYTDGSANTSDKTGGWAWWVHDGLCNSGYVLPATNNQMEIQAVAEGLEALEWDGGDVEVVSDSAYVIDCMRQKWYLNWRLRGWRTSTNSPVANADLWKRLLEVVERWPGTITWTHVRGHGRGSNDKPEHVRGNAVVDRMAGTARKSGGIGENAARQRALNGGSVRRKRVTMAHLEHITFLAGGREYVAARIDDQTVTLTIKEDR